MIFENFNSFSTFFRNCNILSFRQFITLINRQSLTKCFFFFTKITCSFVLFIFFFSFISLFFEFSIFKFVDEVQFHRNNFIVIKSFFDKFFFAIFNKFFLKKFNSLEFEFFKFLLHVEVVLCIVDFDNDNYKFIKVVVRFFFTYKFFFDVDFKFSFEHVHFEIVISIRLVEVYFETLSIINRKRLLR